MKSLEGYDGAWVEEAQSLSQRSLDLLRPTIRKEGSEIWFSWNPRNATDPVDVLLRGADEPPDAIVRRVNYMDNPWFPDVLARDLEWDRLRDPDKFKHVWLGEYNSISEATVFRNWREGVLDIPEEARPLFGADWGFAADPTVGVRCWLLSDRLLYIDKEVYQVGCEIDETPALFDKLNDERIPNVRKWQMRGDSARPETISYMNRNGFTITPSIKGPGSVEEGVAFLKSIDIVVHPDCKHVINELMYYSYKVDPLTLKVIPVLLDKKNHTIDALRYALEEARKSMVGIIDWYRQQAALATADQIGNTSVQLGTTGTATLVGSTTGGTLAAQTWSVICVALSLDALVNGSVVGGIQASITRTNADGSSDTFGGGSAQKSASATVVTTGATSSISASVAAKIGAVGYAWFWGTAGAEVLGAITTINSALITAAATGAQTAASLPAADWSQNALAFDGLLYQALKPGSNATVVVQPAGTAGTGTPLTSDSAGGIVEIDAVLKNMWDLYRLSPDTMWVNSQEALNISKKIVAGSTTAAQRFVFETVQDAIGGGIMVRTYLNRFSMQGGSVIDIKVHPNVPAGTILMTTKTLPYPLSGVGNIIQIRTRQDYYQIEWPLRSRKYEYGVYSDQVLQNFFPPSMAVITNIGNG
ncbi:PBSX family phage terminase large subunit [Bradyrhizobium sp. 482_C4_N1_1]|uniref:PBSX family phage terminase large subunit n=1 Tax=unclassified Bradyrhizobium TaxID=2631580 RepID=UPI003F8CA26B